VYFLVITKAVPTGYIKAGIIVTKTNLFMPFFISYNMFSEIIDIAAS